MSRRSWMIGLLLAGCCMSAAGTAPRPDDRMARIALEMQGEFPDVARHFATMSYDESFAAGAALSSRGMPRLTDAQLLDFSARRLRLLTTSDAACEAMLGGGDGSAALAAMESLTDDELRAWFRLSTLAQSLELGGGPRPLAPDVAQAVMARGVERIRAGLTPADQARWDLALTSTLPSEACFVERTATASALAMPPEEGAALLRAMLESAL